MPIKRARVQSQIRVSQPKTSRIQLHSDSELTFDPDSGALLRNGTPMMLIALDDAARMAERIVEMFGTGGLSILFFMGEALGRSEGTRLLQSWNKISAVQRVAKFKQAFQRVSRWGFGRYELLNFSEKDGNLDIVFRLTVPYGAVDQKSSEFLSTFLKGYYQGLASITLDSVVAMEFRGCGYDANCYEFYLHARSLDKPRQDEIVIDALPAL
ncbi:MAG: hypothetical protein ACE5PO_01790 [Candidatus Bathyarchaeia archaeon]